MTCNAAGSRNLRLNKNLLQQRTVGFRRIKTPPAREKMLQKKVSIVK